jgi:hypothetical protein
MHRLNNSMKHFVQCIIVLGSACTAHAQWTIPSSTLKCTLSGTPLTACTALAAGFRYTKTLSVSAQCYNCQTAGQASITASVTATIGVSGVCTSPVGTFYNGGIDTSTPDIYAEVQGKVGTGSYGPASFMDIDCNLNEGFSGPPVIYDC